MSGTPGETTSADGPEAAGDGDPGRDADGPAGPPSRPRSEAPPRTLVGGVGYHDLRDFSVGPLVAESLAGADWPPGVTVEDLSYDPVKIVHRLAAEEPPFERLLVVGAVRRGRRPGSVTAYRWDRGLPDGEEVQARVAEAVTGVVGLENLLVVIEAFEAAPPEVWVVEVEPEVEAYGRELSPAVARAVDELEPLVRSLVAGVSAASLPEAPLGGFGSTNGGEDGRAEGSPGGGGGA